MSQYEGLVRAGAACPGKNIGMDEVGQKLCTLDDPRSGTGKVRADIDRVHPPLLYRGKFPPPWASKELRRDLHDLIEVVTAGHNEQNFRLPGQDIFPGQAHRIGSLVAQVIHSS